MGNNHPRAMCYTCKKWFRSRNSFLRHVHATGHVTKLMGQSRFINKTERLKMKYEPKYSTNIVQVKAGEVIPETFLNKLIIKNQSAFGMAVRESNGVIVEKFPKLDTLAEHSKLMRQIMENTKKYSRMFCFHAFPTEFDEDEVMPFRLIKDSKGGNILCVAIDGDFPKHVDTSADAFSEPYMVLNDWLGPKVASMYELLGNNPGKLFDFLKTEQFKADFNQVIGHRGILSFMPNVGELFTIEKNDVGIVSPTWGQASYAYDYTESAIAAATVEPPKATVKTSRYASDTPAVDPPKPEVVPPKEPEKVVTQPAARAAAAVMEEVEIEHAPPKNLHGKALKGWYRSLTGALPGDWESRPTVRVKSKRSTNAPAESETAMAAAMAAAKATTDNNSVIGDTMPIISGPMQGAAVEMIKKYLGDGSLLIDDPIKANEEEQKLATFAQLMKLKNGVAEVFRWRASFIFAFVKAHPETAALAVIELRNMLRDLMEDGEKKLGDLTGTEGKPSSIPEPATAQPSATPAASEPKSKYA